MAVLKYLCIFIYFFDNKRIKCTLCYMKKLFIGGALLIGGMVAGVLLGQPSKPVAFQPAASTQTVSPQQVTINTGDSVKPLIPKPVAQTHESGNATATHTQETSTTIDLHVADKPTVPKVVADATPVPVPQPKPPVTGSQCPSGGNKTATCTVVSSQTVDLFPGH